jgi:hypothetical protein
MMPSQQTRFRPGSVDYGGTVAANYRIGRALSGEAAAVWRGALELFVDGTASTTILDLGAGTDGGPPTMARRTFPPDSVQESGEPRAPGHRDARWEYLGDWQFRLDFG